MKKTFDSEMPQTPLRDMAELKGSRPCAEAEVEETDDEGNNAECMKCGGRFYTFSAKTVCVQCRPRTKRASKRQKMAEKAENSGLRRSKRQRTAS